MAETPLWPPTPLMTVKEASDYFRVSTATIQRWCAAGKLPTCRIGREWRILWGQLQEQVDVGGMGHDDPGLPNSESDQATSNSSAQ